MHRLRVQCLVEDDREQRYQHETHTDDQFVSEEVRSDFFGARFLPMFISELFSHSQ